MRVLFFGLGGIGQRHLRNLRTVVGDELEVHAYRVRRQRVKLRDNLSVDETGDVEADYGVRVHTDLAAALAVKPDAAFICNPSGLHTEAAIAAAQAGAHLFLEKPVASTLDGLDRLAALIREKQLVCHVGYQFRFHPGFMRLKSLLDSGFFGPILSARAEIGEYLPNWHKYEDYRTMYASRADQGGGVILSQIHEMDLIYWFFGVPDSILCHGGHLSGLDIDVEDVAVSLMQCRHEGKPFPLTLIQDYLQRPPTREFKIVGERGIARMNMVGNRFEAWNAEGERVEDIDYSGFQRNDMFVAQIREFTECIEHARAPAVDLHAGTQSLRLALAARKSLAGGQIVRLAEEQDL